MTMRTDTVDIWYWGDSMSLTQVRGRVLDRYEMPGVWIESTLDGRNIFFPWTSVQRMIPVDEEQSS